MRGKREEGAVLEEPRAGEVPALGCLASKVAGSRPRLEPGLPGLDPVVIQTETSGRELGGPKGLGQTTKKRETIASRHRSFLRT